MLLPDILLRVKKLHEELNVWGFPMRTEGGLDKYITPNSGMLDMLCPLSVLALRFWLKACISCQSTSCSFLEPSCSSSPVSWTALRYIFSSRFVCSKKRRFAAFLLTALWVRIYPMLTVSDFSICVQCW